MISKTGPPIVKDKTSDPSLIYLEGKLVIAAMGAERGRKTVRNTHGGSVWKIY